MRVRDLSVAVERSNATASDDAVRAALEADFLQALLASCEAAMLDRLGLPDGVAFVRSVDVRWSIDEQEVFDEPRARELGRELGVAVAARCERVEPGNSDVSSHAVVFANRADYCAFCMHAEATSSLPWFAKAVSREQLWRDVAARGSSAVTELLIAVARWGAQDTAFTDLPVPLVQELVAAASHSAVPSVVATSLSALHSTETVARAATRATKPTPATTATRAATHIAPTRSDSPVAGHETSVDIDLHHRFARHDAEQPHTPSVPPMPPVEDPSGSSVPEPAADALSPAIGRVPDIPGESGMPAETTSLSLRTAWGGMAFLLGPAVELELGEHLWCAGLPEPLIFDAVARLLAPADLPLDDAAPQILSGLAERCHQSVEAADWAAEEVASKALRSLAMAFERRELEGDARVALEAARADLVARAAAPVSPVVADCAAAMVALFHKRIGDEAGSDTLQVRLARPAKVHIGDHELVVSLSMDSIDIDVRRAGLDFNPGWMPWMRKRVFIAYEDGVSP